MKSFFSKKSILGTMAAADADKMFEAALEAGANDVVSDEENPKNRLLYFLKKAK